MTPSESQSVSELVVELHYILHELFSETVPAPRLEDEIGDQIEPFLRSVGFLVDDDYVNWAINREPIDQIRHAAFLVRHAFATGKIHRISGGN